MIRGFVQGRERGFTLLEVLLAFVVFALSFAVVLEIVGGSISSSVRARQYTEAALLGQSLMDMVGVDIPIMAGEIGGASDGGYEWQMVISPYLSEYEDDDILLLADLAGTDLYWIDLDVSWGEGSRRRDVQFATVRGALREQ